MSIKIVYNDEIRRFLFAGQSFQALNDKVLEVLGLEKSTPVVLKYRDEDNDLITITTDVEFKTAVVPGKLLRLEVIPKNVAIAPSAPVGTASVGIETHNPFKAFEGGCTPHTEAPSAVPMAFSPFGRGPYAGPCIGSHGKSWGEYKKEMKKSKKKMSPEEWAAFKKQFKEQKEAHRRTKEQFRGFHKVMKKGGKYGHYPGMFANRGGYGPYFGHHGNFGPRFGHHYAPPPAIQVAPQVQDGTQAPPQVQDGTAPGFVPQFGFGNFHGPYSGFGSHGGIAQAPPQAQDGVQVPLQPQHGGPTGSFGFGNLYPHHHPFFGGFYPHSQGEKLLARHVKDVTIEDGTKITAGTQFVKTWRVRNEGQPWPAGCRLTYNSCEKNTSGDNMNGPEYVVVEGSVDTNQEVDISVPLVAPAKPGRYTGYWKMRTPDGRKFGQRLWVTIVVPSIGGSSSDEDVEADRYEALVDDVLKMGFTCKRHRVFRLLQKHNGEVGKVALVLAEKQQKAERKAEKASNRMTD